MVRDMNGVEIHKGQRVRVHQKDETSIARVVGFLGIQTQAEQGHWVDIDKGNGPEGMMSYILEKIDGYKGFTKEIAGECEGFPC